MHASTTGGRPARRTDPRAGSLRAHHRDRALPARIALLARFPWAARTKNAIDLAHALELRGGAPQPDAEPREERGSRRRRLDDPRPVDRGIEKVRLELHEE